MTKPSRVRIAKAREKKCSFVDCNTIHYGMGWCQKHYQRWRKYGSPSYFYVRTTGAGTKCEVSDCQGEVTAARLCPKHNQRKQKWGKKDPQFIDGRTKHIKYSKIKDCEKRIIARDLCSKHYQRWAKHGDPLTVLNPIAETLEEYLDIRHIKTDECWLWTGSTDMHDGYGKCNVKQWKKELAELGVGGNKVNGGTTLRAHRLAYAVWVKPIPKGTVIHHTCHNRPCINPNHLQAITPEENIAEMIERRNLLLEIRELKKRIQELEDDAA